MTVRRVRCRGGNFKFRALRLDTGNFSWGSEVRVLLFLPPAGEEEAWTLRGCQGGPVC